jgi:hypothetical protein
MIKIYLNDPEETLYVNDPQQFYLSTIVPEQYFAGTNVFINSKGETVLIESWTNTTTNVNPVNNFKTFLQVSNVQIQNLDKLNGTYVTNYIFNDNYENEIQKELVVYYIGVINKNHIKVTFLDFFSKVKIQCVN